MSEGVTVGKGLVVKWDRTKAYGTVKELIQALSQFPPEATVGVKAFCCSHAHSLQEIRMRGAGSEQDWDNEAEVIIDAAE